MTKLMSVSSLLFDGVFCTEAWLLWCYFSDLDPTLPVVDTEAHPELVIGKTDSTGTDPGADAELVEAKKTSLKISNKKVPYFQPLPVMNFQAVFPIRTVQLTHWVWIALGTRPACWKPARTLTQQKSSFFFFLHSWQEVLMVHMCAQHPEGKYVSK